MKTYDLATTAGIEHLRQDVLAGLRGHCEAVASPAEAGGDWRVHLDVPALGVVEVDSFASRRAAHHGRAAGQAMPLTAAVVVELAAIEGGDA